MGTVLVLQDFGSAASSAGFAVLLIGDTLSGAGVGSPLALVLALLVIRLGEVLLLFFVA